MIISEEVETRWNGTTKKSYVEKGYVYTKHGDKLTVKVKDLDTGSGIKVNVKCSYCKEVFSRSYADVFNSMNNSFSKKYACVKCGKFKQAEELVEKQKRGLLAKGDNGYWSFKENRIKGVQEFIQENDKVDNLLRKDSGLHGALLKHGDSLKDIVELLGYDWDEVSSSAPNHFYKDFENIRPKIEQFISNNKRFPSHGEIINDLRITSKNIIFHGGVEEFKKKMDYNDDNDLIDDRGFKNSSRLEFIVAQYLIANDVHYKREEYPFQDTKHRCDFLIKESNGILHYIEVWGYGKEDMSYPGTQYNISRNEKESMYNSSGLNLVSIEYEHLERKKSSYIQEYLKDKFENIKGLSLFVFDDSDYLHPKGLTNEMILNEIMIYSTEEDILPTTIFLRGVGMQFYYTEILKRFDSYDQFAGHFNKKLTKELWTEERVLDTLDDIVSKGKPINKQTMKAQGLLKATSFIFKTFGTTRALPLKLIYYNDYWDGSKPVSEEDIIEIEKVSKQKMNDKRITKEETELSNKVLIRLQSIKENVG